MEDEGMKITVVGALAIAGVFALLVLLALFLRDQSPEHGSNPQR
jgi:hypothetical protein